MMSRKHYVKLARELAWHHSRVAETPGDHALIDSIAEGIATICAEDNSAFNRQRFLDATKEAV